MIFENDLFGKNLIGWTRKWITLKEIDHKIADQLIIKNHYSGKATTNRFISFGVYLTGDLNVLLGAIQIGYGIRPKIKHTWGKNVSADNSIEFDRMWLSDLLPKFSETICLSALCKLLKHKYKHIKYILTYADGTVGNTGTIYKAGNYTQCGKIKADFYILESGERVHPVSMWHRHGSRAWALLQSIYPNIKKADGFQYRFIYEL